MRATSHLAAAYRPEFGLMTDLYQLTMAAGYYHQKMHERRAVFHLFFRKAPFGGDFALSAGLALAVDIVRGLRFLAEDVQYLGRLKGANGEPLFREPFLNYLQRMRFSGDVYAVPEGHIALPHEPLLRIEAPLIQAQLLETALLTVMNFSTLIATKAARIRQAAGEDTVLEFGLRRAQGIDGGLTASRSAFIGGCNATSNVWAGRFYGIPVKGTHAHSWVMSFPTEDDAFEAYARAMPNNCILLVDTYGTVEGVRNAIEVGRDLRARGHELIGIRLDSGDLAALSIKARELLDAAGFPDAQVVASDSLDEHAVRDLKARGAQIDIWGIGTNLVTARDQPALGGVYKLAALQDEKGTWVAKIKRSDTPIKTSNPGRLSVERFEDAKGTPIGSVMHDELLGERLDATAYVDEDDRARTLAQSEGTRGHDLLQPIFQNGELVYDVPSLNETRETAIRNWATYSAIPDFNHNFGYGLSPGLHAEKAELLRTFGDNNRTSK